MIECDFKISLKCKGTYLKVYRNVLKGRVSGKDRCIFCFNSLTKSGVNIFNFKFIKNEEYFESINTELKAYLLGWIAGDGCIKKDGLFLEISKKDIEILKLFKEAISPNSEFYYINGDKGKNTVCWKVHSVKIVKDLLKHLKLNKYGKKSDKICLPDLPEDLLWIFIRGLFDSDGCVISPLAKGKYPTASICSTSLNMRSDIRKLCDKDNIHYYKTEGNSSVIFGGVNCIKFLDRIYINSSFYLKRKYDFYKIWKTWVPYMGTDIRPRKVREFYPLISEEHKEKIRESNRKRNKK